MKAILVFSMATVSVVAHADLRTQTADTYKKISAAFLKKDIRAFESATKPLMAKDFKFLEQGKAMSYDEMVKNLKVSFDSMKTVQSASVLMVSSHETPKKADSACSHRVEGTMMGPDNKSHKFTMKGTSSETWEKDGKVWKMKTMKWVNQSMTLDGKPFDFNKMVPPPRKPMPPVKKAG